MAVFLDGCRFNPAAGGTTDFTYSTVVTGYQSPASAGVVNAAKYKYRAESADLTQWELGEGTYTTATGILTRTTVLFNSAATGTASGQSGAGSKISFSTVPQVAIVALAEDLGSPGQFPGTATNDNANSGNIGEAVSSSVASGAAVTIAASSSTVNVTSILVPAGDWEIHGNVCYSNAGTTPTLAAGAISSSSATLPTAGAEGYFQMAATFAAGLTLSFPTGNLRVSVSAPTTFYLVALQTYTGTAPKAYGAITARRAR